MIYKTKKSLLPHYRNIIPREFEVKVNEVIVETDPLLVNIFAPDPQTGVPRSDLHIVLSKDSSPEISQYIRDNLMRPNNTDSSIDDADFAIASVKGRYETRQAFADRLRDLVQKSYKND